jgi:hypothetical protein
MASQSTDESRDPEMDTKAISELVDREFACDHPDRGLTRLVASSGITHFRIQCTGCGATLAYPRRQSLSAAEMAGAPDFDPTIAEDWGVAKQSRFYELIAGGEEDGEDASEARAEYEAYLLTSEWRGKRTLVMKRCGGICEGCMTRRATQVHHKTYDHLYNELLFELVALCRDCHARVHHLVG